MLDVLGCHFPDPLSLTCGQEKSSKPKAFPASAPGVLTELAPGGQWQSLDKGVKVLAVERAPG